ncbi:MAG TPA: sigma-70 family RNA polymerase sigma factor [Polyangium sp.]|nr:sigma-70 family RNA polymerase sigma factor [Polyangium sp.]
MHPIPPLPLREIPDISRLRCDIVEHITAKRRRFRVRGSDVDDLAQSALEKIHASMHTYQPERGSFRAWAFGIVHHVLCRHARDMQRYQERFSEYCHNVEEKEAPEPSPEECLHWQQARSEISNVADSLESRNWTVFTLHALDDMSHAEIGREVGMSEAASQKCYQRTRDKLADCLDDEMLVVLPLVLVNCYDKRFDQRSPRSSWIHRGTHYTGQIASLTLVGWLALSAMMARKTQLHEEFVQTDPAPIVAMAPQDKPASVTSGEPVSIQDKPVDKHESAPAPRVPPTKRTPRNIRETPAPKTNVPLYNPPASPASYRQLGR